MGSNNPEVAQTRNKIYWEGTALNPSQTAFPQVTQY